jgi:diadenosine tetraphosphate (Ap4A) HIT family hydrolase
MNDTLIKFGYPDTRICEWQHWTLLLRLAQPTLGSCILAAKSDVTAFGDLPPAAFAELADVTAQTEAALTKAIGYAKINYLMLMMVDPHVHFHVIPRYEGMREHGGVSFVDSGWPKTPDLAAAHNLETPQRAAIMEWLRPLFPVNVRRNDA